ncbi:hypothetical protein CPB83DRAFT_894889 [Crepidotus variabilis]|uniref:Uncharacterized protein n=1 Tax=Crepidotus variabilis TaxID=179855 RepID=A0A9P6EED0_9AGAR|nr:hypothetical protein CPB83DRAFT_894889 [Crepidotus variabilis]
MDIPSNSSSITSSENLSRAITSALSSISGSPTATVNISSLTPTTTTTVSGSFVSRVTRTPTAITTTIPSTPSRETIVEPFIKTSTKGNLPWLIVGGIAGFLLVLLIVFIIIFRWWKRRFMIVPRNAYDPTKPKTRLHAVPFPLSRTSSSTQALSPIRQEHQNLRLSTFRKLSLYLVGGPSRSQGIVSDKKFRERDVLITTPQRDGLEYISDPSQTMRLHKKPQHINVDADTALNSGDFDTLPLYSLADDIC